MILHFTSKSDTTQEVEHTPVDDCHVFGVQVINDGECCRSCDDSLCTDTPITINQCSSGTLSETFDLGSTEAYVEHV